MIKRIRHPLQQRRVACFRTAKLLRGGLVFSFLLGIFVCLGRAEAQTYSEGKNEEGKPSVSDTRERTYSSNGQPAGTERIRVKGVGTTPAELVSGSRANYLQKKLNLGPLGDMDSVAAPFSTMTTTHDVIEDQQLRTIGQTLQYMPSVNLESRGNGVFRLINRGYESDVAQNSRIDGLNAIITAPYATEQFDSVTVLNGAAGALYGPQSPAGMMLMTQKRPTDKPFFNFNFGYDSNGSPLESLDTSVGKGPVKIRFNYLNQTGQSYTSNSNQHRNLYSGNIDLQVTKHTKLELDGSQYNSGIYGLPGTFNVASNVMLPNAPNTNNPGYGTNDAGLFSTTSTGTMKLFHDFSKTLHLKIGGLYQDAARNSLTAQNTIYAQGTKIKETGKICQMGPCYGQQLQSSSAANDFRIWSNYAHLNWDMTDPILHLRHKLNVGTTGYSLTNLNPLEAAVGMTGKGSVNVGGGGLYGNGGGWSPGIDSNGNSWGSGEVAPGAYWNNPNPNGKGEWRSAKTQVQNVMFGDSFDVGSYFTVMGQLSWGWITTNNYDKKAYAKGDHNALSGIPNQVNGAFDPTVALTFHPTKRFSAYFNWGQDTSPGTLYAPLNGEQQVLTPAARSTQYEGAIKYLWKDRFLVSLGGFGMSRPYTIGGSPTFLGNQNDMGLEFQVSGALTRELSMYGGVTYDNARYHCTDFAGCANWYGTRNKDGSFNPAAFKQDSQVIGVAPWQSDFLLDWHPLWLHGVSFNSNIHYQGTRQANANNTSHAPEYVTLDLGMRYVTHIADHMLVLRGNIDNVTNQKYWGSLWSKDLTGSSKGATSDDVAMPQTWHITASYYF